MRAAILSLGWVGTLVFAALWLLSWWQPIVVERAARELIRIEVQKKVDGKLDALSETSLAGLARAALRRTDIELDRAKVRAEVAARVADMLDEDCACRRRLSEGTRTIMAGWRDALVRERGQLAALIEAGYASVRASLLRESASSRPRMPSPSRCWSW